MPCCTCPICELCIYTVCVMAMVPCVLQPSTYIYCSFSLSGISAFALLALVLPGNYPYYLDLIHSLSVGPALLSLAKFGIAFPVSYHTLNGIRHLFWDSGKGFKIPEVYRSGYVVIVLSILTSIAAIAYM
uniref:Succinate dehydrogenase cytochrome b560 subunit, mitochondrial n=1 Tax=Oncorhynchus mykiss TaxID=8022 RepID=A0A8C7UHZ4_ONCMY